MALVKDIYSNNASTTVAASKSAVAQLTSESWTVASSTGFPVANSSAVPLRQFTIVDVADQTEVMRVTNVSGTTWTVTRGVEGSTTTTHAAGFTIKHVVSADQLEVSSDYLAIATSTTTIGTSITDFNGMVIDNLPAGTYVIEIYTQLTFSGAGTVTFNLGRTGTPTTSQLEYSWYSANNAGSGSTAVPHTTFNSNTNAQTSPCQFWLKGTFTSTNSGTIRLSGTRSGGTNNIVRPGSYIRLTPVSTA